MSQNGARLAKRGRRSQAAVCRGGLFEGLPKACTHRVAVLPSLIKGDALAAIVVDGTRSDGGAERAAEGLAKRVGRADFKSSPRPSV